MNRIAKNPIPELKKGSKTPYLQSTREQLPLTPFERRAKFEESVGRVCGPDGHIRSWYALGSGKHWVGVLAFVPFSNLQGITLYGCTIGLFSGRSWKVAENKALRWLTIEDSAGPQVETGAGSPAFLFWAVSELKEYMAIRQSVAERGYPSAIIVYWSDEARRRAYRWLLRLGFREGKDAHGDSVYIYDFLPSAGSATRRNPVKVELHETGREPARGTHERLMWSPKAAEIIERRGAKIKHNIKYIVTQAPRMPLVDRKGEPGVLTLCASPDYVQKAADARNARDHQAREFRISPYTLHTILHRLGDEIMPDLVLSDGCWPPRMALEYFIKKNIAVPIRMEQTWDTLFAAVRQIKHALRASSGYLGSWLPRVIDTKACREGWIRDSNQALAELVPMHLLYSGIRFRPTPASYVPDDEQRARIDAAAAAAIPAFGAYIDGMIQMLQGCRIWI